MIQAATLYVGSLDRAGDLGITLLIGSALLGLAGVAVESGDFELGGHLLGAAEGLAASLGAPLFPRDQPIHDRCLAALEAGLTEDQLAAAREAGQALTIETAISEARTVAATVMASA